MTTSLDDVKTSSHAARHIISEVQSTSTEYFTLWLTKSHYFSATQTSLKQLGMLLMLHCIFWLEMEYPAKCKCSYKFLQERVLTHDAADSAKLTDIVRIINFLYCILYCIVLMVLFLQSWCVLWLNCCRIYYSLHFVSDQCTRHLFVMYIGLLLHYCAYTRCSQ